MTWHTRSFRHWAILALALGSATLILAQTPDNLPPGDEFPPPEGGPGFGGPPPFGSGGGGPGGPGFGGVMSETKLVKQFDQDGNGWLNAAERKAARAFLAKEGIRGPRGPGGRPGGFGRPGEEQDPAQPGPKLSPAEVKTYPEAPLYASNVVRTLFLEFEDADWEKELAEFKNTDVEVPAKLTMDGKTYTDVGVHFHGMSSFMMVSEGRKRSLVLSLDFIHDDQRLNGYRKLNLLNAHEDASFLRTVLALETARDYLPAPKANFVRVVINGESWGVYVNQQHFNKDFTRDAFNTTKGARWKVPGSPNGRGGLEYLGEELAPYQRLYEIKSKDDPKDWAQLIRLCKVLNTTPPEQLEAALTPLLDLEGVLKFLAWENVLVNGDGYWTRASDYSLFMDGQGRFHVVPYDANETFSSGRGPGGPGGPGGFGPGMFLAPQMLTQADTNGDRKLTQEEFLGLADRWFAKLDSEKAGQLSQDQFTAKLSELLPAPQGRGGFGPPGGGRGGFGPAMFIGRGLFTVADGDKNGSLTAAELKNSFGKWFVQWDTNKVGALEEAALRSGLNGVLPRPEFGGPGGLRGQGGPGGGGVNLDPLVSANDASKPLISKLLAVPSLRTRYLRLVHDMAERSLDWNRLGPIVAQYRELITADVKTDTRKLESFEAFQRALATESQTTGPRSAGGDDSLKSFAEQRRAFLLNHAEVKKACN